MKVQTIDLDFLGQKHAIASFLVEGPEGYLLVETGPASVQENLEARLTELGVELDSIKHVLVSHIHLDHSGGAGHWAKRGATVHVHEKGKRHLVDPSRLLSSAARIYQDQMDRLWGTTLAIPDEQVMIHRNDTFRLAGLEFTALDTPGHAGHHLAYQADGTIFTGDVAAVRLPGSKFVSVPAPPPEFHLESWLESIEKLKQARPSRFFLTHFGEVSDPIAHLESLEKRLKQCVEFVGERLHEDSETLTRSYQEWDRKQALEQGVPEEVYEAYEKANPTFMSASGLSRYWRKKLG